MHFNFWTVIQENARLAPVYFPSVNSSKKKTFSEKLVFYMHSTAFLVFFPNFENFQKFSLEKNVSWNFHQFIRYKSATFSRFWKEWNFSEKDLFSYILEKCSNFSGILHFGSKKNWESESCTLPNFGKSNYWRVNVRNARGKRKIFLPYYEIWRK